MWGSVSCSCGPGRPPPQEAEVRKRHIVVLSELDETSRQLLGEVTPSLPPAPGRPAREDYEYVRQGVCNLFLVTEPLAGWRHVTCSDRRTRIDWAHCIKDLVDPDKSRPVAAGASTSESRISVSIPRGCGSRAAAGTAPSP